MINNSLLVRSVSRFNDRIGATAVSLSRSPWPCSAWETGNEKAWIVFPRRIPIEMEMIGINPNSAHDPVESMLLSVQSPCRFWISSNKVPDVPFLICPEETTAGGVVGVAIELIAKTVLDLPDKRASLAHARHMDETRKFWDWPEHLRKHLDFKIAPKSELEASKVRLKSGFCLVVEIGEQPHPSCLLLGAELRPGFWTARLFWTHQAPGVESGSELWRHMETEIDDKKVRFSGLVARVVEVARRQD